MNEIILLMCLNAVWCMFLVGMYTTGKNALWVMAITMLMALIAGIVTAVVWSGIGATILIGMMCSVWIVGLALCIIALINTRRKKKE